MNYFKITTPLCVAFLLFFIGFAASEKASETPPWMEDVTTKGGRSTYLVPKGAKREIVGSQVIIEPPNEYVARRIYEMEQYIDAKLTKIEENQALLKEELKEVKKALEEVRKTEEGQENEASK